MADEKKLSVFKFIGDTWHATKAVACVTAEAADELAELTTTRLPVVTEVTIDALRKGIDMAIVNAKAALASVDADIRKDPELYGALQSLFPKDYK